MGGIKWFKWRGRTFLFNKVLRSIENISAITEQSAAGAEQISTSAQEQAASIEERT